MSDPFDVIPFDDIKGDWKKLGSGSFGNVYKGSYLGIDVAIKEILPSSEYDVPKYFEREWRLLKESRHPNVVLYLGLSRAPDPDGRIFIISEFVEGGNVRQYIWDKSKPFSWRMRISFATDITRALAYLHARKCIHRDLKGENLLVTANGRLKITDFGFARIAARNEEESRRLTFCGTDAYMSPEILLGNEFDLPTDIFSLGVIFAEISARKLADDRHFKRTAPSFQIDPDEIRELASPGCPDGFAQLAIDCLVEDPLQRPGTREILERLRAIEAVVVAQPGGGEDVHTGSIRFTTGNRRPGAAPRIPSFGQGIGKDIRSSSTSDDESENELVQAVMGLENVTVEEGAESRIPLMQGDGQSGLTDYSTTVIRGHSSNMTSPPTLSSVLTVRASPNPASPTHTPDPITPADSNILEPTSSVMTIDSYYTAGVPSAMSIAAATEGGSTLRAVTPTPGPVQAVHRFTLIKPGTAKRTTSPPGTLSEASWGPLEFFTSGLLGGGAKCDICMKRLGRKLVLECDDCGLRAHLKCGEAAPLDCSTRAEISKLGRTFSPPVHAVSTPPIGVAAVKAKANGRATK